MYKKKTSKWAHQKYGHHNIPTSQKDQVKVQCRVQLSFKTPYYLSMVNSSLCVGNVEKENIFRILFYTIQE
jgi:hypothetical protein